MNTRNGFRVALVAAFALGLLVATACSNDEAIDTETISESDSAQDTTTNTPTDEDTSSVTATESDSDSESSSEQSNSELLIGVWKQPLPSPAVMRFTETTAVVAMSEAELETNPFAEATYTVEGNRLTFHQTGGACFGDPTLEIGVYDIVVAQDTLAFTIVQDECAERNVIGGETWTRLE